MKMNELRAFFSIALQMVLPLCVVVFSLLFEITLQCVKCVTRYAPNYKEEPKNYIMCITVDYKYYHFVFMFYYFGTSLLWVLRLLLSF